MGCASSIEESTKSKTNQSIQKNCILYWNSKYKTQYYHWWPLKNKDIETEDVINNLYAKGGGLHKYDALFDTKSVDYQIKNYSILPDSKRSDKNWAGFCDRAACLSCLYRYPEKSVVVEYNKKKIKFTKRDIESLMIVVSNLAINKSLSVFYGNRNNSKNSNSIKKEEPYPLELIEILKRFSKEDEPFVMDIDNGAAVWNYSYDQLSVNIENIGNIEYSDDVIPKTGRNIVYRFKIKSTAYPKKNIDIKGLVNYNGEYIAQKWLSKKNPDFLWKKYRIHGHWTGKSDMNPEIDAEIVYEIYKKSITGEGDDPTLKITTENNINIYS